MSEFDATKNYYATLGAQEDASRREIERCYKQLASQHHPDRGGDEDRMKALNEAYRVLRDESLRKDYDETRARTPEPVFVPVTAAPARDVGASGQALSAFLCLALGAFLLVLVRSQWIWFLWPLAILAILVIAFGVLLAHSVMLSLRDALAETNPIRRHTYVHEALFWTIVSVVGVGLYFLLSGPE